MDGLRISAAVVDACNKLGIEYKSANAQYMEFFKDAQRLGEIYLQLKEIIGDLMGVSERYGVSVIGTLLLDDINILEKIDHDVFKLARKLVDQEK